MDNPIQALIRENPTPAVIGVSQVAGYTPAQTYATPTSPAARPSVNCLFVKVVDTALVTDHKATATFALADFPDGLPDVTEVTIGGDTYAVHQVRRRYFRGVQNGWTLELI